MTMSGGEPRSIQVAQVFLDWGAVRGMRCYWGILFAHLRRKLLRFQQLPGTRAGHLPKQGSLCYLCPLRISPSPCIWEQKLQRSLRRPGR
ncbi:hypothetical protein FKM82_018348 [Ascaphus truei]